MKKLDTDFTNYHGLGEKVLDLLFKNPCESVQSVSVLSFRRNCPDSGLHADHPTDPEPIGEHAEIR